MERPLVEDLDLPALAAGRQGPAPPAEGFDRERRRPAVEQQQAERGARNHPEGSGVRLTGDGNPIAIDLDLDHLTLQQDRVPHAGSRTATVSTWVVWGNRSNACTRPIRKR